MMQLILKTPYGEMSFDMDADKVTAVMQTAMAYAEGKEIQAEPVEEPTAVPEPAEVAPRKNTQHRRADSLFGDYKSKTDEDEDEEDESEPKRFTPSLDFPVPIRAKAYHTYPVNESEPKEYKDYKGFLLIKCEHCGRIKGFCAKTPITEYTCNECYQKTPLQDLKVAFLKCSKCGVEYKYKTNITDESFTYNCMNCDAPVDLALNKRRDTYVTVAD